MRDISTRPPSDSPHHSAAASSHPKKALALTKLATGLVSGFESLIHGLSSIPVAGSYTPVIKTLPEAPVAHQPAPRVKGKKRAAVKAAVVKTAEATKESASKAKHKTKEHLKTPLGKTTVVQAALVLGLFAYVTNLQGKTHQLIQEKAGNQAAATTDVVRTYRQYRPASGHIVELEGEVIVFIRKWLPVRTGQGTLETNARGAGKGVGPWGERKREKRQPERPCCGERRSPARRKM